MIDTHTHKRFAVHVALWLVAAWLLAGSASAAVVARWDFQNPDADLSAHKAGTSGKSEILGGTVDTGGITDLAATTKIRGGAFTVVGGFDQGLRTTQDGATANHRWRDYLVASEYTPATLLIVYKPNFSGLSDDTHVLFQDGEWGSSAQLTLFTSSGGDLIMRTSTTADATVSAFAWDSDTWYVIAASWEPDSPIQLYLRALTGPDTGTTYFVTSTVNTRSDKGPVNNPLEIGGATNISNGNRIFGGDGAFALVQLAEGYTATESGFDALYTALLPEPSTAVCLVLALGVMTGRQRRRA